VDTNEVVHEAPIEWFTSSDEKTVPNAQLLEMMTVTGVIAGV